MIKLSLKQQLAGAFAGGALITLAVGAVGGFGVRSLAETFIEYRQSARESLASNEVQVELLHARQAAFEWRATGDAEAADTFHTSAGALNEHALALGNAELAAQIDAYRGAFEIAVEDQVIRNAAVAEMHESGTSARRAISQIMSSAYNDGDSDAAYYAGVMQERVLLSRFYGERFLVTNEANDMERTLAELAEGRAALADMRVQLQDPERRQLADEAEGQLDAYAGAFERARSAILERNESAAEMDAIGPQIYERAELLRTASVDRQNTLGPRAQASAERTQLIAIIAAIMGVIIAAALALIMGARISGALKRIIGSMTSLAKGQNDIVIEGAERTDEIGDMARALQVFKENAEEVERLNTEQEAAKAQAEAERKAAMTRMADEFEGQVGAVIVALAEASESLQEKSRTLTGAVNDTSQRSTSVAAAAEQASTSVGAVASAAEELTASIREVSTQLASAADAASASSREAAASQAQLDRLNEAVMGVDQIVGSINDVAEQTNLLALNATIEAARAGEAGKGFAVVASEVKALAEQTQKLTEEINQRLGEIGGAANDAIEATKGVIDRIADIDNTSTALAAAVEEQTSATGEISSSAQQAADGAQTVSADITGVQSSVSDSASVAETVDQAAAELRANAERLRTQLDGFLAEVRAA
ncbi:MAG: methyl-accepting chemotaxis protein [Pseudomonadota bacterium]